ncbi:MAG: VOC family protein, partial [Chloroflexia bacterium]
QVAARLAARGIENTGPIDRGFMDSIYFRDPNGQLLELACYKFEPPVGYSHSDVLATAHRMRVAAGDYNIEDRHLADAIIELTSRRAPRVEDVGAGSRGDGARDGHEVESRL